MVKPQEIIDLIDRIDYYLSIHYTFTNKQIYEMIKSRARLIESYNLLSKQEIDKCIIMTHPDTGLRN